MSYFLFNRRIVLLYLGHTKHTAEFAVCMHHMPVVTNIL